MAIRLFGEGTFGDYRFGEADGTLSLEIPTGSIEFSGYTVNFNYSIYPTIEEIAISPLIPTVGSGLNPNISVISIVSFSLILVLSIEVSIESILLSHYSPSLNSLINTYGSRQYNQEEYDDGIWNGGNPLTFTGNTVEASLSDNILVLPSNATITLTRYSCSLYFGYTPPLKSILFSQRVPEILVSVLTDYSQLVFTSNFVVLDINTTIPKATLLFTEYVPVPDISVYTSTSSIEFSVNFVYINELVYPSTNSIELTQLDITTVITGNSDIEIPLAEISFTGIIAYAAGVIVYPPIGEIVATGNSLIIGYGLNPYSTYLYINTLSTRLNTSVYSTTENVILTENTVSLLETINSQVTSIEVTTYPLEESTFYPESSFIEFSTLDTSIDSIYPTITSSIDLTGYTSSVVVSEILNPINGSFGLSGINLTLTYGLNPSGNTLTLFGLTPILLFPTILEIPKCGIYIYGMDVDYKIEIDTTYDGRLVFNTYAPTIEPFNQITIDGSMPIEIYRIVTNQKGKTIRLLVSKPYINLSVGRGRGMVVPSIGNPES